MVLRVYNRRNYGSENKVQQLIEVFLSTKAPQRDFLFGVDLVIQRCEIIVLQ